MMSIILFIFSFMHFRSSFTWTDLAAGFLLVVGLLYYRYGSQNGYASLLNNLPYYLIGFCIAIIFKYSLVPRGSFLIYTTLALIPFLYIFIVLKKNLEGQGYLYALNRNFIPQFLVIATSLQVMNESLQNKKHIIMFPSALTVICSYFSYSRAGLLVSLLLFFIILTANIRNWIFESKIRIEWIKAHKMSMLILLGIVVLSVCCGIWFFIQGTRLASLGFKDPARASIAREFFNQQTCKNFVIGFRPHLQYASKLHNSFLTMLSYYGIFSFGLYFLIGISLLHYMKHSFTLFGVLGIWCIYSLVESISPLDVGDFLLIPLIMIALYQKGWELFPDKKKPMELVRSVLKK